MKCKNCGAPLNLNVKFCPNCGTPNEEAAKHIKDMESYGRKFNQTRNRVVGNSKWFVEYIAPLTSFVISAVILAAAWTAYSANMGYDLSEAVNNAYNRKNKTEIQNTMNGYIDSRQYEKAYFANSKKDWEVDYDDVRGWRNFYSMEYDYMRLRRCITTGFDYTQKELYTYTSGNIYSGAAESVYNIENTYSHLDSSYYSPSEKCMKAADNIIEDMNLFLKAYCNFTDEDISKLPSMDVNQILTLMTGRMNNENK